MYQDYLPHFEALRQQMAWRLSTLVELETPTSEKSAVDTAISDLAEWANEWGAEVNTHTQPLVGDFLECWWNKDAPQKPILLCCHIDTVHPMGSTEKMPTRIEGDILYGAGAYDMKGGIAIAQTVIEELHNTGTMPTTHPLAILFTTDEEIGSPYSRRHIERLAKDSALVLVLEFCDYSENIVTARKGVGIFQITAIGREAHSGGEPEKGINAIVEIAHQIDKIMAISDPSLGTTVIPTVIRGGTRHNVIPGACEIIINVRVRYRSEAERVDEALTELSETTPYLADAELVLTGDFVRPPMEHDAIMIETMKHLKQVTGAFPGEEFRGEGSDANFSAALGVPTLCGFGPSGEGAHTPREQVYLPSMPRRAALLASVLQNWYTNPD